MSQNTGLGRPGYATGYSSHYSDSQNQYGAPSPIEPPPRHERRAGGYGAYNNNPYATSNNNDNDNHNPYANGGDEGANNPYGTNPYATSGGGAPKSSTRSNGTSYNNVTESPKRSRDRSQSTNRRSIGSGWNNRSPTRRPPGDRAGGASAQIEEVLKKIRSEWSFLTEEKCVPLLVALQFMDNSSLGLASKYDAFRDVHAQLQRALRQIVNEEHQGFNSSIGRFHAIQHALGTSQSKIRLLKDDLHTARDNLSGEKPELAGWAKTSQNYDDMLMTLADIEELQSIPERLEAGISEKRFIAAVDLLQNALKKIRKPEMAEIDALRDLKVYLSNQEHALTDILTEELHNHLYLKSPYCEHRWKQHASHHVRGVAKEKEHVIGDRALFRFLDQLDSEVIITDDPAKSPEADTFAYIQLLIEALNSLGRLESAVETLVQRLPVELFRIVEKTSTEIEQRYPINLRSGAAFNDPLNFKDSARMAILNDLFATLYARFETIAEGHRVVHEVISGITKRDGFRSSSTLTGGFRELWKLFQSEIRSLFHDYLASTDDMFGRQGAGVTGNSVFQKNLRDKQKKIFKLNDMDSKSSDLTTEREDLQNILTQSVPGLVSDAKRVVMSDQSSNGQIDGIATGHRLLVDPNVFNMAILLPPSLTFLDRLKEVVPPSSDISTGTLTSFLDDFLINVFLPQLDETLVEMSAQIFVEANAFSPETEWSTLARKPIFKGTAKFYRLIQAFCEMLVVLPHDPAFSQLIINQLTTYYERCYSWYKAMVARTTPHPLTGKRWRVAAYLTEDGELTAVSKKILVTNDPAELSAAIDQEIQQLIDVQYKMRLEEADLILDRRSIAALSLLLTSVKWLSDKVGQLRYTTSTSQSVPEEPISKRQSESYSYNRPRRWTLISASQAHHDLNTKDPDRVFLPLTTDATTSAFDTALLQYSNFAGTISRMLHVEARTHILFYLSTVLARPFALDRDVHEPDPEIGALNANLIAFDEELGVHVHATQRAYITNGLSGLVDSMLISAAQHIKLVNAAGCAKLQLAILVLQQNLKNVEAAGASLARAALYWELFAGGAPSIADQALKQKDKRSGEMVFSKDELKTLIRLWYQEQLNSDQREIAVAAQSGLSEALQQIDEVLSH